MKKICLLMTIALSLSICTIGIQAQTTQTKLDNLELMKQWVGIWKTDIVKDTVFTIECKSFNKGFELYLKTEAKGKLIIDWKTLVGYDKKNDKLIESIIFGDDPELILYSMWFTSANKCEEVLLDDITNPDKAKKKWTFEFKTPDLLIWTGLVNNIAANIYTLHRVK
jgi:hypothetical protein